MVVVVVESEPGRSVSVAYVVDIEAPTYTELHEYVVVASVVAASVVAFVVGIEVLTGAELNLDTSYVVGIEAPTYAELDLDASYVVDTDVSTHAELDSDASYVVDTGLLTYTELVAYVVDIEVSTYVELDASVVVECVVLDVEQLLFAEPEVSVEYGDRPP
jgi:hypothetical protein